MAGGPVSVLAATAWKSNAELIEACRDLGYLVDGVRTLDPTFGHGVFYRNWMPDELVATDLDVVKSPIGMPVDFRHLRWARDGEYGAVVFDPPYKLNGTPSDCDERYGVHVPARWQDRMQLCLDGISECIRVLRPKQRGFPGAGYLLVKCMDQVVSGRKVWQTHVFTRHAEQLGCRLVDQLHLLVTPRPQPDGRRQVHAQQNFSTMLVFRLERGARDARWSTLR
jgi:hypothetical protein